MAAVASAAAAFLFGATQPGAARLALPLLTAQNLVPTGTHSARSPATAHHGPFASGALYSPLVAAGRSAKLAAMNTPPPVNHVFVDFENVHEIDPALIGAPSTTLLLLIGPEKKKLELDVVAKLLEHAAAVHLVRLPTKGKNAVDFALAYYLGQAVLADPAGSFHLVSKDKGYDPLVEHLRSKQVRIQRHDGFAPLATTLQPKPATPPAPPAAKTTPTPPAPSAAAQQLLAILVGSVSRPRTRRTLTRHAITVLGNKLSEAQATALIQELCTANKVSITAQDKVEYRFPAAPAPKSPA